MGPRHVTSGAQSFVLFVQIHPCKTLIYHIIYERVALNNVFRGGCLLRVALIVALGLLGSSLLSMLFCVQGIGPSIMLLCFNVECVLVDLHQLDGIDIMAAPCLAFAVRIVLCVYIFKRCDIHIIYIYIYHTPESPL